MFKLFFITNRVDIALVAEKAGIDRIWVDLETLGKEQRQKNLDSVKSKHTVENIKAISKELTTSEMLVRVNPWNNNSINEIDEVINAGADIIMLPYWKSKEEAEHFINAVSGRCKTNLLIETKEAVHCIDSVLELKGIDELHIGLNDLQISYKNKYMFEPYANGLLEKLANKIKKADVPFGIGGIGSFGTGLIPSPEQFIIEQYRLGSTATILSRSFCDVNKLSNIERIKEVLVKNVSTFRQLEKEIVSMNPQKFDDNYQTIKSEIADIVEKL
jgi:HpcH/HpaI aldolase/citrate lyase family.